MAASTFLGQRHDPLITTLHAFAGHNPKDVKDPYYPAHNGDRKAYLNAAREIEGCVLEIIPKLEQLVELGAVSVA